MKVSVANGKYEIIIEELPKYKAYALRYGEPWRDILGDNLIHALATELYGAREELKQLKYMMEGLEK